ncbi:hypothetical protein H6P81_018109 [Aristolochia fimbriata]|uniref:Uncharacterized protein n=1 Tax=Aristolochia fimbriata TaxID=158543 RepID=A0AAV7E256_ARIFI|nr:hypothetical protein H6P81_018109 [Aristolochia fimbriata]
MAQRAPGATTREVQSADRYGVGVTADHKAEKIWITRRRRHHRPRRGGTAIQGHWRPTVRLRPLRDSMDAPRSWRYLTQR